MLIFQEVCYSDTVIVTRDLLLSHDDLTCIFAITGSITLKFSPAAAVDTPGQWVLGPGVAIETARIQTGINAVWSLNWGPDTVSNGTVSVLPQGFATSL